MGYLFYSDMMIDSKTIKITLTSKSDAAEFLKLESKCFEMDENLETMYYWVPLLEYSYCYKAEISSCGIVGGIISMPTRDDSWYINSLFVHPDFRKEKIATKLLKQVINGCAKGKTIYLEHKTYKPHLLEFYKKHGFTFIQRSNNYFSDGDDRFMLARY